MPVPPQTRLDAERLYDQALDLVAAGDALNAADHFRQALCLDPGLTGAMHGLVRALQDAGDYEAATQAANHLIAHDPEDPLAYTSLSILYQHQGKIPEAEAAALRAKLLGWKLELRHGRAEENLS